MVCVAMCCPNPAAITVNFHSYAQNVIFYNFESLFSSNKCEAIMFQIHLHRQILYDCEALFHQVKSDSPLKVTKLFHFQNFCLSHGFQWLLLTATMVEI